jgi:uncharacterized lipoprotein YddW (UPF0748 family)
MRTQNQSPSGKPRQSESIRFHFLLSKGRAASYFFARIMLNINKLLRIKLALAVFALVTGALQFQATAEVPPITRGGGCPAVEREFRGLWVATVDNVDWPSKPGLTTRQQQLEWIIILDRAVRMHLNVIVLQVRPCCDAIYDSKIEPWSEYLTGQMGRAPQPYYDPLAFAIEEAHKRGLELHAWFNPYRAHVRASKSPISRNHVSVTHPSLVRTYGKYLWLDPTVPATRDYSLSVIMDVVRRYDIDGVHFDDYFYPYPEKSGDVEVEFPDDASWARYQKTGGKMSRNDWRRENVSLFVRSVYEEIKKEKPWVKFGIAPFGIWRPKYPAGITGFDSYDKLYCDSRRWLANGWVDYLVPQLYWPVAQKAQSFPALLNWWVEQNSQHRLLCPGMKVEGWKGIDNGARETVNEIESTRRQPGASGDVLWHSKPLLANRGGVADALRKEVYSEPALVPAFPWLRKEAPPRPVILVKSVRRELKLNWQEDSGAPWQWVIRKKSAGRWTTEILPGEQTREVVPGGAGSALPEIIEVSAVNRYGAESEAAVVNTAHLGK